MIDFEAEYALMTTEPPYDPNEDQMNVTDMSINEDSIPLGGEQTLQKYDEELRPSTHNTTNRNDAAHLNVYNGELQDITETPSPKSCNNHYPCLKSI